MARRSAHRRREHQDSGPSEDMSRFNIGHRINGVPIAECPLDRLAKELDIMIDIGERQGGKHSVIQQQRTKAIREEIKRKMKDVPT